MVRTIINGGGGRCSSSFPLDCSWFTRLNTYTECVFYEVNDGKILHIPFILNYRIDTCRPTYNYGSNKDERNYDSLIKSAALV